MKCKNCGFELPDGAKFCKNCGSTQQSPAAPQQPATAVSQEEPTEKRRSLMPLIIGLSVIALALIIAVVIVATGRMKPGMETPSTTAAATTDVRPTVTEEVVITSTELPVVTTEALTAEPTEVSTSQDTEPVPVSLGEGSVEYKGMTCSYRQTGESTVELKFVNNGPYKIEFWWQSTSDRGFTVVATDEFGNKKSEIYSGWGSVADFNAYSGEKTATIEFNQLSGKITEIKILGASYNNTEKQFDFNHGEIITITSD